MKVSIIIPVYNATQHLNQCLDSILNQDFNDFELLLINDGSTDTSGEICDDYAGKDKRIKVFHQNNAGVSAARNKGIENANGEWITFMDSDDYIQKNYFEILNTAPDNDWILHNIEREIEGLTQPHLDFDNQSYHLTEFISKHSLYPHFPGPCGKFFKADLIKKNGLSFNKNLKFGEDALFNLKYLGFCQQITTSNQSAYVYRDVEDSLSKLYYDVKNDTLLFEEIKKELEAYKDYKNFYSKSIFFPLSRYLRILYYDKNLNKKERIGLLKTNTEKYYDIILKIYNDPKIKYFFILAHRTGCYQPLDYLLKKIHK